jgi:NADH-quinone oxidoreductase subunit E
MFPPSRVEEWKRLTARYPAKRAALLPLLHEVQDEVGYLSDEAIEWVAEFMGLSPADVLGVITFYWMYDTKPRAKYRLAVCKNICCDIRGADSILEAIERRLSIRPGQTTPDGRFSLKAVECMGACTAAPMLDLNGQYHENLTPDAVDAILEPLAEESA